MLRRTPLIALLGMLALAGGCTNKKVSNPLADVGSKQPDKVLFDRAMDAMKHNRFDVSRLTLQTLINTYPDSEFIARAKLGVADSWYAEGGSAAMAQAEIEYSDFETFFPNMPEAAEAQLKIANIHYQEMEQPDRDYTHALRARDEYRKLIMQYPEQTKLVATGKQRLLEVEEVLAEREFRIGRFYYLRESYPAGIARLRSVVDQYPLYSRADEALYLLGQSYENEITMVRSRPFNEAAKAQLIQEMTKKAGDAYSLILTRYPVMVRAEDAKARLIALHQPVPKITKAAIAQNKAEDDSRRESGMLTKVMRNFSKHPDVASASRVGEPTLVDPQPVSATQVAQEATQALTSKSAGGSGSASVETIGTGAALVGQPAPRSDAPAPTVAPDAGAPVEQPSAAPPDASAPAASAPDANELKPNMQQDNAQALPPPQQVNEIQAGSSSQAGTQASGATDSTSTSDQSKEDDSAISSSKHKKKKGLRKIVHF
jgi:outer membrane protein assembly factor BamD